MQASEYAPGTQQLPDGTEQRFVGSGSITVDNITPHGPPFDPNRGVTFVVTVGWSSPLNVCTDITLLANAPQQVLWIGPRTTSGTQAGTGVRGVGNSFTPRAAGAAAADGYTGPVTHHSAMVGPVGHAPAMHALATVSVPAKVQTSIEAS